MVFRRRDRPPLHVRARELVYPSSGWKRTIEYAGHRIRRIPDTPHRIALGFACGVFSIFTPFFGLHFVTAAALAWAARGNLLAALIGTFLGNPLTFPFIAALSLPLGRRILGHGARGHDFQTLSGSFAEAIDGTWAAIRAAFGRGQPEWGKLAHFFTDVFLPYAIGGLAPGLLAAFIAYWLLRPVIAAYQAARRARLAERARARAEARAVQRRAHALAEDG